MKCELDTVKINMNIFENKFHEKDKECNKCHEKMTYNLQVMESQNNEINLIGANLKEKIEWINE